MDSRKEVHLAELPYQVRSNNPQVRPAQGEMAAQDGGNGKRDPHHQPSHGPAVQHWSCRNRREEEPEL